MELTNIQFLTAKNEMCSEFPCCRDCPIRKLGEEKNVGYGCLTIIQLYPNEVTAIINNWAAQHLTYLADFRKKYPNATFKVDFNQSEPIPVVCRKNIYGTGISECDFKGDTCKRCWEEINI